MNRKLLLLNVLCAFGICVCAQSISTDKPLYDFGEKVSVSYSNFLTNSNIYFYKDVSLLPSDFFLEGITFDTDTFSTSVLEPGRYVVKNELNGSEYASSSFRVADISLENNDLRILLIADPHVMAQSLVVSEGEAYHNAMDANRKMLAESEGIFNQLVDSIIKYKPDLALFPGDLTKDGEKFSHLVVVNGLKKIQEAGIRCLVIPGNHDYNNPNSVYYASAESFYTPTLTEAEFAEMYAAYGYGGKSVLDTASLSYYTDEIDGLRIIGVDATRNRENTLKEWGADRNRSYGSGLLRANTLQWVIDRADEADMQGRMVIVMMHHQMLQHFNSQDKVFATATIEKGDSVAQVFLEHNIRTVLTGHMHINNITKIFNSNRTDSLIEISTGSPIEYPGCWRWLTINSKRDNITVNTRFIQSIAETSDFMLYGRDLLAGHADLLWSPVQKMLWNGLKNAKTTSMGSTAPISTFLDILINNENKYSDVAYKYLAEPMMLVMLMASEANENRKHGRLIIDMLTNGLVSFTDEVTADNTFSYIEKAVLKGFVQTTGKTMFEDYLGSLINDCSYCGLANENTTNDLYLSLVLPTPQIKSSIMPIESMPVDNHYYDMLGRRFSTRPSVGGVYLYNGKKILIQ